MNNSNNTPEKKPKSKGQRSSIKSNSTTSSNLQITTSADKPATKSKIVPRKINSAKMSSNNDTSLSHGSLLDPHGAKPVVGRKRAPSTLNQRISCIAPQSKSSTPSKSAAEPDSTTSFLRPAFTPQINIDIQKHPVAAHNAQLADITSPTITPIVDSEMIAISQKPGSTEKPQKPSTSTTQTSIKPSTSTHIARNAFAGLALTYARKLDQKLFGPIKFVYEHLYSLFVGLIHLFMSFFISYLIVNMNDQMREIFIQGGLIPNAGKLLWVYFISAFVWSVVWILINRTAKILTDDVRQYERVGRGFFSPNSRDWDKKPSDPKRETK